MNNLQNAFDESYFMVMSEKKDEFIDTFHYEFIHSSKLIESEFSQMALEKQKNMLFEAVVHLLNFYVCKIASTYLINLTAMHKRMDIPGSFFDLWVESLIISLQKVDPENNSHKEVAWRVTLAPGIEFMKHNATGRDTE